jgi:hypothetical protein
MISVPQSVIKHKVGLLNLATELGNVSRACKVMGFSRDTFDRYQSAVEAGGVDALIDANRKKPNLKNRVEETTETAVVAFRWSSQPSGRFVPATSCASVGSSFHRPACAQCGFAVILNRSRNGSKRSKLMYVAHIFSVLLSVQRREELTALLEPVNRFGVIVDIDSCDHVGQSFGTAPNIFVLVIHPTNAPFAPLTVYRPLL